MVKNLRIVDADFDQALELDEGQRLLNDFITGMDNVICSLGLARDQVVVESAGLGDRQFGGDARLKLSDAICLPILGGQVLRNGQRYPSPTFTKRSLEGAISTGELKAVKVRGKWTVTTADLQDWLSSLHDPSHRQSRRTNAEVATPMPVQPVQVSQAALGAVELTRRALAEARQKRKAEKAGKGK